MGGVQAERLADAIREAQHGKKALALLVQNLDYSQRSASITTAALNIGAHAAADSEDRLSKSSSREAENDRA